MKLAHTGENHVGRHSADRYLFDEQKATMRLLGMTLVEMELTPFARQKLGAARGVAVLLVERDGDAYLAGVTNGDLVAEINGVKITRLQDVKELLRKHEPFDPLLVFILDDHGWRLVTLSFIGGSRWPER